MRQDGWMDAGSGTHRALRDWDLRVSDDPTSAAAAWIAERLRDAVAERGTTTLAVSGGSTAPPLFDALVGHDVPWDAVQVWQVDERVVPDGHPERNAEQLGVLPATVHRMPVTAPDLVAGAADYARTLPDRFDLVHLGLGDDGHTASWPPGDERPIVSRRLVEVVADLHGFARMTLTAGVVNDARCRVMLTLGASKAALMARWAGDDHGIPVGHVQRAGTVAFVDPAAAPWQS